MRRARSTLVLALCAMASACAGVEVISAPPPGSGTNGTGVTGGAGGGATPQALLIGSWTHVTYLQGPDGDLHESRTTWEFRSDGSAIRSVRAWNLTEGIYDVVVGVARWRAANGSLTVTWLPPGSGAASFRLDVRQDVLFLDADQYARVR